MADSAFNPQVPNQAQTTQVVYQPNQSIVNPIDGKQYTVKQQTPGKGLTVVDPQTTQEMIVPENQINNVRPAVKTTSLSITSLANSIFNELLGEDLPLVTSKIERKKLEIKKMQEGSENWRNVRARIVSERKVKEMKLASEAPLDNESRQIQFLRVLAKNNKGRDEKTGIPLPEGETNEIEVGMTEFPKDIDKKKNPEGYGKMTMEEMDAKFLEDHTHFYNERKLPSQTMTRDEDNDYFKGQEKLKERRKDEAEAPKPRYSSYDDYLDEALGISKKAGGVQIEEPTKKPVQLKEIKTAPKIDEYYEPEVIPEAEGDLKTAIQKFKETQAEITKIQANIQSVSKPLQEALTNATKTLQADLVAQSALLSTYLNMIHDELNKTSTKVVHLEKELYAVVDREQASTPPASLAQIMKKAQDTQPDIFEAIGKIKALLENENTKMVIEQLLYKYPASPTQEKKLGSSNMEGFIKDAVEVINFLKQLNLEL